MSKKFNGLYRTESARLKIWDYRSNASYFITICTQNRESYFGEIKNGTVVLSRVGILADVFWHEIKNHAKKVTLDQYVIMPDHIHGIITLNNGFLPELLLGENRFQNQGKNSISSIIGSYKAAVQRHANRLELKMKWQSGFYDVIITDSNQLDPIRKYIKNNPKIWTQKNLI